MYKYQELLTLFITSMGYVHKDAMPGIPRLVHRLRKVHGYQIDYNMTDRIYFMNKDNIHEAILQLGIKYDRLFNKLLRSSEGLADQEAINNYYFFKEIMSLSTIPVENSPSPQQARAETVPMRTKKPTLLERIKTWLRMT